MSLVLYYCIVASFFTQRKNKSGKRFYINMLASVQYYRTNVLKVCGGEMEKKQILQEGLKQLNAFVRKEQALTAEQSLFSLSEKVLSSDIGSEHNNVSLLWDGQEQSYRVFVQAWAPQKDINTLISQIKSMPAKTMLFANFINPVMAEKLRRRSIEFVDCAGNLSLKNKQFNFYVKGKKLSPLQGRRVRGRAFNSAGLKLIFAVFNQPKFLQAPYREISNKINIALGSVGPVIDDLYKSGYILDEGERKLVNKKRLFERWVDGYLEKLRPKQLQACYTCDDENWWKNANPFNFQGVWGGEVVIAKSTPFMMPETISLYFSSSVKHQEFAEHYGLRKDDEGDICVYKSFWSPSYAGDENPDGISPMIVYADIVDSINPGSWDVAKTFYGDAVAHMLKD